MRWVLKKDLIFAPLLQVLDVCSLGSCSRFWRELCGSDSVWEALCKDRWPQFFSDEKLTSNSNKVVIFSNNFVFSLWVLSPFHVSVF